MPKFKLSPWHDGRVKPIHRGVYHSSGYFRYRLWNGLFWCVGSNIKEKASKSKVKTYFQDEYMWRGILK